MDIVIEAAAEAAGELLSAGIDAVVDKAAKHKSKYKSEYRRKHTMAIKSLIINPGSTSTKIGVCSFLRGFPTFRERLSRFFQRFTHF